MEPNIIVVTGGAGFIGSNIVHALKKERYVTGDDAKIVVIDDMDSGKFLNIVTGGVDDIVRAENCLQYIEENAHMIKGIFHQGAESSTTATDADYVMRNNYELSKGILHIALEHDIPLLYASSASIYGDGSEGFTEKGLSEKYRPLNLYAFSKYSFDQYLLKAVQEKNPNKDTKVVGLRYFNVYGPQENHKGTTASVVYHFYHQAKKDGVVKPFKGSEGFQRDFIHVDDVVRLNMFFMNTLLHLKKNKLSDEVGRYRVAGRVYNCGTGTTGTFQDIAEIVAKEMGVKVEPVPFPPHLKGQYQEYTKADTEAVGWIYHRSHNSSRDECIKLEDGIKMYLDVLKNNDGYLS